MAENAAPRTWIAKPAPGSASWMVNSPIDIKHAAPKHAWLDWCPPLGRMIYFYGDASGSTGDPPRPLAGANDYRQEVYSFDAAEPDQKKAWKIVQPYCTGKPGNRPHRPDWWACPYDENRQIHWIWPGPCYATPSGAGVVDHCMIEEFAAWRALDPKWHSNVGKSRCPMLTFDPVSGQYTPVDAPFENFIGGSNRAWGAIHDPDGDQLVRVTWASGGNGPVVAMHFDCKLPAGKSPWSYHMIDQARGYPREISQANVGGNRYFFDRATRKVMMIDACAWPDGKKAWLYSYHVDTHKMTRESQIPVPDMGYAYGPPSSTTGALTRINFVGDPVLRKGWYVVMAGILARDAYAPGSAYSENNFNERDVLKVLAVDLDTYQWADITPKETVYSPGSPRNPRAYYHDPKRLAIAGGAQGIIVGYDPKHRLLVTMAGYASDDVYMLDMGAGAPPTPSPPPVGATSIEPPSTDYVIKLTDTLYRLTPDAAGDATITAGRTFKAALTTGQPPVAPPPPSVPPAMVSARSTIVKAVMEPQRHIAPYSAGAPENITLAWCGMAYDYENNRGYAPSPNGHNDGFNNASYMIDVLNSRVVRLHDTTPATSYDQVREPLAPAPRVFFDGQPCSRHTGRGVVWIPGHGVMMRGGSTWPNGDPDVYAGLLDVATGKWKQLRNMERARFGYASHIWVPEKQVVVWSYGAGQIQEYDPVADRNYPVPYDTSDPFGADYGKDIAFSLVGNYLYAIDGDRGFRGTRLIRFHLWTGAKQRWQAVPLTGPDQALATVGDPTATTNAKKPLSDMEYEPDLNALVIWTPKQPATLTLIHLEDGKVEQRPHGGQIATVAHTIQGVYGRFRRYGPKKYCLWYSPLHPVALMNL